VTNYFRAFHYLNSMIKRAYWNQDRLAEYQNKRLRKIIKYAYDYVPYYHKKFRKLGIKPLDIKTKKDLNRLPIISKDEIRENLKEMISKKFNVNDLKMLSTSGSTGEPLILYITGAESEFRKAKHLRANISCGQKLRDRWVVITAPHHFGEATKLQRMLGFYAPTPVSVFNDVSTQILTLERMKPDILDGYSSSLLILAKELKKREVGTIRPRFIIGGAELIDDYSRHFVEKVLGAPFYDQYSSVELERMAWQCPVHQEYHMDVDAIIIQFVDKNGDEVSTGERGEIICTSLFNYAMPFIRYAIGDVGIPSDGLCTCGRTLPLMKVVEGRRDSLLLLPDGRILTPRTFTIAMNMFKFYRYIDQFRVIQKKPDLFEFNLKMKDDGFEESIVEIELLAHLKTMFKLNMNEVRFEIKFVEDIPLDRSGKLMAVVSELKSDALT
jgi:phenylacetate-CoA ligase